MLEFLINTTLDSLHGLCNTSYLLEPILWSNGDDTSVDDLFNSMSSKMCPKLSTPHSCHGYSDELSTRTVVFVAHKTQVAFVSDILDKCLQSENMLPKVSTHLEDLFYVAKFEM